jgi:hypothetical protein
MRVETGIHAIRAAGQCVFRPTGSFAEGWLRCSCSKGKNMISECTVPLRPYVHDFRHFMSPRWPINFPLSSGDF